MTSSESKHASAERDRQFARIHATINHLLDQVSHDFRTPLTVIKEFATLMHDGLVGEVNPKQSRYLDVINDRADDLTAMIDNVLDAGKFNAGLFRGWRQPVCVAKAVRSLQNALSRKASIEGLALDIVLEPNLPTVYADQDQFNRILVNVAAGMLGSFRKPKSASLWACSEPGQNVVRIGLTVHGGKPEPHRLKQIHEALDHSRPCDMWNTKGVTLSMTLARCMVDFHLGEIQFEQSDDKQESTLSLTLPVNEPVQLLKSYLGHLTQWHPGSQHISLISATISPRVRSVVGNVVDEFLQHWAGMNDLVVHVEKHRWLLLALGDPSCADQLLGRLGAAWSETLAERPSGLLPQLKLSTLAHCDWTNNARNMVERFEHETRSTLDVRRRPVVLAVDDDTIFLSGLKLALTAAGYEVLTATDGQSAIELARTGSPDVVLLDHGLPELDGLTALERLREDPRTAELPVIVLSVHSTNPATRSQALELGAHFVLRKPITPATIADVIAEVVDRPVLKPADEISREASDSPVT